MGLGRASGRAARSEAKRVNDPRVRGRGGRALVPMRRCGAPSRADFEKETAGGNPEEDERTPAEASHSRAALDSEE